MNTYVHILRTKPLYISSTIVPLINLSTICYYKNYYFLVTGIPISITSILYHLNFPIKNIRYIDIFFSMIAYIHHLYISTYYVKYRTGLLIYSQIPLFYLAGKILQKYEKHYLSDLVHAFMHLILVIGTTYLNVNIRV